MYRQQISEELEVTSLSFLRFLEQDAELRDSFSFCPVMNWQVTWEEVVPGHLAVPRVSFEPCKLLAAWEHLQWWLQSPVLFVAASNIFLMICFIFIWLLKAKFRWLNPAVSLSWEALKNRKNKFWTIQKHTTPMLFCFPICGVVLKSQNKSIDLEKLLVRWQKAKARTRMTRAVGSKYKSWRTVRYSDEIKNSGGKSPFWRKAQENLSV